MNKRQTKKQRKKEFLLGGRSYKENKKLDKFYHEDQVNFYRNHREFYGFTQEHKELMQLGLFTKEEILEMYKPRKPKIRHRQLSKVN